MNASTFLKNFTGFTTTIEDVWINGAFGIDIGSILVATSIVLFFLLFRKILYHSLLTRIQTLTAKTSNTMDDAVVDALKKPVSYVPVVFGFYVALQYIDLKGNLGLIADKLLSSVIIFVLFWIFYNLVEPFAWLLKKLENFFDRSLITWIKKLIKGTFIFIGLATILELWGIRVGPIIAGFGLFGVAVALGAQDLFKNLISGILVLAENRFCIGDWIKVEGVVEGTVENIGFRSTKIRRFDKAPVFVPNSKLSDNSVINFSEMTCRRIAWTIALRYDSSTEQLRTIRNDIEEYLLLSEAFVHPPEALLFVYIDAFNDSSIDIMLYCFTRTTVWKEWLDIKEALLLNIKEIVLRSGTDFAFPSQSLYVEHVPEGDLIPVPHKLQNSTSK